LLGRISASIDGIESAVGTKDAPTHPAMVPPNQQSEWGFTLIASLDLCIVNPVVLAGVPAFTSDAVDYLAKKRIQGHGVSLPISYNGD
jgi:hypothetical protein